MNIETILALLGNSVDPESPAFDFRRYQGDEEVLVRVENEPHYTYRIIQITWESGNPVLVIEEVGP